MSRVRISTTVDADELARCRTLWGSSTSKLMDRALLALAEELEGERELAALERHPYEDDADLAWTVGPGADLPYDGDVPEDVQRLARTRRQAREQRR